MSVFDSYQDIRLENLSDGMIQRDAEVRRLTEHLKRLEDELTSETKRLALVCRAMWSLIEENTELTAKDLEARIDELAMQQEEEDLCLGDLEARIDELAVQEKEEDLGLEDLRIPCPHCGAVLPADRDTCQFCGKPV